MSNPAKKIAIVDDESELAETMNEFLNSNGFESVFFTNPNKLLEYMKNEPLAVIFFRYENAGKNWRRFI